MCLLFFRQLWKYINTLKSVLQFCTCSSLAAFSVIPFPAPSTTFLPGRVLSKIIHLKLQSWNCRWYSLLVNYYWITALPTTLGLKQQWFIISQILGVTGWFLCWFHLSSLIRLYSARGPSGLERPRWSHIHVWHLVLVFGWGISFLLNMAFHPPVD